MRSVLPAFHSVALPLRLVSNSVRFAQHPPEEDPVETPAAKRKTNGVVRLPNVVIDDAKPQDAPQAFPVWLAGFQDASTAPWVKQSTNSPLRRLQMEDTFINALWVREGGKRPALGDQLVVMRDRARDEIVGVGALTRLLNRLRPNTPPKGMITALAIHPDHRGKGYGRQLAEHLVELSRQRGFSHVRVLASDNNRTFLQHLGFARPVDTKPSLLTQLQEWLANKVLGTPYLMQKTLPQPQFET